MTERSTTARPAPAGRAALAASRARMKPRRQRRTLRPEPAPTPGFTTQGSTSANNGQLTIRGEEKKKAAGVWWPPKNAPLPEQHLRRRRSKIQGRKAPIWGTDGNHTVAGLCLSLVGGTLQASSPHRAPPSLDRTRSAPATFPFCSYAARASSSAVVAPAESPESSRTRAASSSVWPRKVSQSDASARARLVGEYARFLELPLRGCDERKSASPENLEGKIAR